MENCRKKEKRKHAETGYEKWGGYMSFKILKLKNQFQDEAGVERKGIFSGIAIFVNGYTEPTANELKRIMVANGGTYHHYFSKTDTTHIIASNLPFSKIQSLKTDIVVSPKWIVDSLSAGELLDYRNYLLYPIQNWNQLKLNFNKTEEKGGPVELKVDDCPASKNDSDNSAYVDDSAFVPENTCTSAIEPMQISSNELSIDRMTEAQQNTAWNSSTDASKKNALSVANPNFLSDFYSNSRLHHLATSGAMFKQYVKDLQTRGDNFTGRSHLKNWIKQHQIPESNPNTETCSTNWRVIMHIDMDCFFVSVGLIKHPQLVNQPVAVTHATRNSLPKRDKESFRKEVSHFKKKFKVETNDNGDSNPNSNEKSNELSSSSIASRIQETGCPVIDLVDENCSFAEIACCSYEARRRGVKNGMLLGVALKLCPDLKTIPYDFEGYKSVSMDLYDIVASYTRDIEAVSCDEMYVDLGDVLKDCCVSPLDCASCIREQIRKKTRCCCSVGIGANMLIARMATKRAKPNGQFLLEDSQVQTFMRPLDVSDLPGVGGALQRRLAEEGIKTCGDLESVSLLRLQSIFGGRTGHSLYKSCRGLDDRPVNKNHERKSVSAEVNYGIRFENWNDTEKFLLNLSEEVMSRLSNLSMKGRTITLKLKVRSKDAPLETAKYMGHGICDNLAKSVTLASATADKQSIKRETFVLLKQLTASPKDIRGIGIQVSKLESGTATSVSLKSYFSSARSSPVKQGKSEADADKGPTGLFVDTSLHSNDFEGVRNNLCTESNKRKETLKDPVQGVVTRNGRLKDSIRGVATLDSWAKVNRKTKSSDRKLPPVSENSCCPETLRDPSKALDVDVLNALPLELRDQVFKEYKALGYFVPSPSSPEGALSSVSPQPGPSGVSSFNPELLTETAVHNNPDQDYLPVLRSPDIEKDALIVKNNLSNMSFSEIDTSFLNALPSDVQEDLKEDFQWKKKAKERRRQLNAYKFLTSAAPFHIKKKRGGSRGSVKKGQTRSRSKVLTRSSHEQTSRWKPASEEFLPVPETNSPFKQPSLCGEYELGPIKALISQWIQTSQTPANVDVKILTDFCTSLIEAKDLEKLDLVLKCINRKTNCASYQWKECFDSILSEVQMVMMENYEAPLHFVSLTRPA